MLAALRNHLHDPDGSIFHRALRVAIVLPVLFWFGLHVLHDAQFALVAAFGAFAALGMADFMGPRRSRLAAHLVLGLVGTVLVVVGTLLSHTLWPAVLVMLAVGALFQFTMVLGGQFALGNNAAILAYVVAVMVPAEPEAVGSRVAGWITALVCSALVGTFLWPRHERRDLYERVADACRALAAVARAAAGGTDAAPAIAVTEAAIARVREVQSTLGYRLIGPPGRQQALLGLIDALGQGWRFSRAMARAQRPTAADRDLAGSIATTLDAVAAAAQACAGGQRGTAPDVARLIASRHAHRAILGATAAQALAARAAGTSVVDDFARVFPFRVLSYITLAMAVDATIITGRAAQVGSDDFVVVEPTTEEGALRHTAQLLAPHLSPRSVWFRNCARAGLALALAVLVAKASDISHAFWVVLATLSILRSNAATTGATVLSALVGTLAGFLLATLTMWLLGAHPLWIWLSLPVAVFLSGYAPTAISFGAGQAMFALLVVELFNLMAPEGWEVGAVRLEAVAVGAAVALVTSLIMWPKGASAALRDEVAAATRASLRFVQAAFGALVSRMETAHVEAARTAALALRRRTDEALAAYIGERGAKRVPLAVWGWLARVPIVMRAAADSAVAMERSGFHGIEQGEAARLFNEALGSVGMSFDDLADRLEDPRHAVDPAVHAAVTDLDMIAGAGARRAAMLAAIAAYVDARRDDPGTIEHVMALVWGVGWIGYLAHVRVDSEPMLEQVASHAGTPWWR
jgi:uncharacterized membrane protein YccC